MAVEVGRSALGLSNRIVARLADIIRARFESSASTNSATLAIILTDFHGLCMCWLAGLTPRIYSKCASSASRKKRGLVIRHSWQQPEATRSARETSEWLKGQILRVKVDRRVADIGDVCREDSEP